jgi:hypothetical protein
MYRMFSHAGLLEIWKDTYCTADHARCVRFQAAAKGHPVADNLLPNGKLLKK